MTHDLDTAQFDASVEQLAIDASDVGNSQDLFGTGGADFDGLFMKPDL